MSVYSPTPRAVLALGTAVLLCASVGCVRSFYRKSADTEVARAIAANAVKLDDAGWTPNAKFWDCKTILMKCKPNSRIVHGRVKPQWNPRAQRRAHPLVRPSRPSRHQVNPLIRTYRANEDLERMIQP